jgi:hydrogenase small subunit
MPPALGRIEFAPRQAETERLLVHVIWMTSGLSCDGESVALTSATSPSLEDLIRGTLPGSPSMVLYNPLLAYESGKEFVQAWYDAEAGKLEPFVLVFEGSVPNEVLSGEGHWSGFGVDPSTGQPIAATSWLDRLAPKAAALMAVGTCAAYGGIPAMRNNPTGAMGVADYLGAGWRSRLGIRLVNLPGCPVQPDNLTETLLQLMLQLAGVGSGLDLDEQGRPRWLFERTVHDGCDRAGFYDKRDFANAPGDGGQCLVKLGCSGPVVKCNVPVRGWVNGIGGCPNVGGICMACTMPGFPDKFMPFMDADPLGALAANRARFVYAPALRYLRERAMRRNYEIEPEWRLPSEQLKSGQARR